MPKQKNIPKKTVIPKKNNLKEVDITHEMQENPQVTSYCPQSVKTDGIKNVMKHPYNYIEINIIKKSRMVDNFYIKNGLTTFMYNKKKYKINEEYIYILPTKGGGFIPTCFYKENKDLPKDFKQRNKGITSKALTLLYSNRLYERLIFVDDPRYNIFIVFFLIATLIAFGIACYFVFSIQEPEKIKPVIKNVVSYIGLWFFG